MGLESTQSYLELLRRKWKTIPFTADDRASTADLLSLDDSELLRQWEKARKATVEGDRLNYLRGWYQLMYRDWCRGRKIIDVGCGLGIDGIHFAENGASVTFIDIVASNIELVRRICRIKKIEQACSFCVMNDSSDLAKLDRDYDAVMGAGSLMHAPIDVMKPEFDELVARLKPETGRFIMCAYPKSRWEREGSLPFDEWGKRTDGEGTPWAEWYDADKLIDALKPARFELVYYCEYRRGDMNCIDLVRSRESEEVLPAVAVRIHEAPSFHQTVTHWDGVSLKPGPGSIEVTTGPSCWSYAAEIPLSAARDDVLPGRRWRFRVKARVLRGEIGVGVLSQDGTRFLVELRFDSHSESEQLSAETDDLEGVKSVIVRNTCRENRSSHAVIEDVGIYCY